MPLSRGILGAGPARPARRTRRLSWREARFASLDFETTGLDYDRDEVVSFGVVPVERGRVIVGGAIHQLVRPRVPASASSMTVHGILPRDLVDAPPMAVARETLRRALQDRYVLAWFAEVELAFLARTFGGSERRWAGRTVDARQLALDLEGRDQATRHTLSSVAARYGIPVSSPHEALDDAMVTAQLFLVLASRMERLGRGRMRDLVALTRTRRR
ncbi:MAG: PolC-type DNA polymerase III [Candidatus Velamenicoccus archaeovorus]